jgi:hypothetical protein
VVLFRVVETLALALTLALGRLGARVRERELERGRERREHVHILVQPHLPTILKSGDVTNVTNRNEAEITFFFWLNLASICLLLVVHSIKKNKAGF